MGNDRNARAKNFLPSFRFFLCGFRSALRTGLQLSDLTFVRSTPVVCL